MKLSSVEAKVGAMTLIDWAAQTLRPYPFRGKGRLFDRFAPRSGRRNIVVAGSSRMSLDMANAQQRQMFMGCLNVELQRTMRVLLRPGDAFLDVGANVGYFTMLAADFVGATGKVIAIEPFRTSYDTLANNVDLSKAKNIQTLNLALAAEPGLLKLYIPPTAEHREYNVSVVANTSYEQVDVPAQTLDQTLSDLAVAKVRLMKIDVEGSESKVFEGGRNALNCGVVEHLSCEMNASYLQRLSSSQLELYKQITSLGFLPAEIKGGKVRPAESDPVFNEAGDDDQLFIHRAAVN